MEVPPLDPRRRAKEVFATYFSAIFDADTFARAKRIFDELGAYNDRLLAMQFHAAGYAGNVEDVLRAYEQAMDPDRGYFHMISDPIDFAVEVRVFSDVVFSNAIAYRDQGIAWEVLLNVTAPEIFAEFDKPYPDEVARDN